MKFPYRRYQIEPSPLIPGVILYRPIVPLRVIGPTGEKFFSALLDTGADHCVLPRSITEGIGIDLDETQQEPSAGLGGQEVVMTPGTVTLQVSDGSQTFQWSAAVGFATFANFDDETAILGHAGCLDYFRVLFDGKNHEFELTPTPDFPGDVT